MPLVMFFDQPSQVYFPQGNDKDEITQADLIAVNKMYKTIFDEINSIGEDTGILPQIIIVDHVDGKNLECKEEFELSLIHICISSSSASATTRLKLSLS